MKNIVNPVPEIFIGPEPVLENGVWTNAPTTASVRLGLGYNYEEKRNRFVIDVIHTSFLAGYGHISIGYQLSLGSRAILNGFTEGNRSVTLADALAYAALYPQNAKVVRSSTSPPSQRNPRQGGKVWALSYVGKKEQQDMLTVITNAIEMQNSALDTVTTEAAQRPVNQTKVNDPAGPGRSKAKYTVKEGDWLSKIAIRYDTTVEALLSLPENEQYRENPDLIEPGQIVTLPYNEANARLPEIIPVMSTTRINTILDSIGQPTGSTPPGLQQIKKELSDESRQVEPGIDQDNWVSNLPDQPSSPSAGLRVTTEFRVPAPDDPSLSKTYYNQREKSYYHATRTLAKNPKSYDVGQGSTAFDNINDAELIAKKQILYFGGKYTPDNFQAIADSRGNFDLGIETSTIYNEPGRPMPTPAGQGYWLLATKIPKKVIDELPGGEGREDNSLSTLARAKLLLAEKGDSSAPGLRRTPLTVKVLKQNIKDTRSVLSTYHSKLQQENITPGMMGGVNLDAEAEYLGNFFGRLEKWASIFNLSLEDDDRLELVFDAKFSPVSAFHNGAEYTLDQIPKFYLRLAFGGATPATMALIFYSPQIAAIKSLTDTSAWPPSTDFVQKYIYPSPIIKPTDIANKIVENTKTDKYPEDAEGASLGRNSFEKGPNKSKSSPTPKTKAEVERQFQKRYNLGRNAIGGYVNILNKAGCETPLAKYLEDAFLIYGLLGGKSSFKQVLGVVIKLLRDELKLCKQQEQLLMQGAGYLDDPNQITRDIEKELNRQFYNCFKVLGDTIVNEVLPPVPPEVAQLIKKGLTPPRGIRLGKTPTTDFFALWRKQLLKLIIEFIKQLILEAMKEVLLAIAGCGPETVVDRNSINKDRSGIVSPYGLIRINDIVDYVGVDLLEIAEELQIYNTKAVPKEEGEEGEIYGLKRSPATLEQLRQLNDDASDMMTDRDVTAILQGSGGAGLISSLNRGFNLGPISMDELSESDQAKIINNEFAEGISRALVGSVQESLKAGDVRYGTLNMSKENIIKYFRRLGQLVGADISLGLEKPLDTKEAYCDSRDILAYGLGSGLDIGIEDLSNANDSTVVAGGLTKGQLLSEINRCIDGNSFKIKNLCELSSLNFDFAVEIQAFWDRIGLPDWWREFLRKISEASRKAQRIQAITLTSGMRQPASETTLSVSDIEKTSVYQFYNYYFGDEIQGEGQIEGIHAIESLKLRNSPVANIPGNHPHYEIGYRDTTIGLSPSGSGPPNDKSFGKLRLDYIPRTENQKVRVFFNKAIYKTAAPAAVTLRNIDADDQPYTFNDTTADPDELVAEFDLEINGNAPGAENTYSVLSAIANVPLSDAEYMSGQNGQSLIDAVNNINKNLMNISAGRTQNVDDSGGFGGGFEVAKEIVAENPNQAALYKDYTQTPGSYLNSYYNVTRTISTLYGYAAVQDRVDGTIARASLPPFGPNGDPCNYGADEQKALIALNTIHQRVFNFVINVAPLFNNGYTLATPDTLAMVSSYLQRKIISDIKRNGTMGTLILGLEFIARTCSTTEPPDGEIEFNPALIQDPEERLKYIIKQTFLQTIHNLSNEGRDLDGPGGFNGWQVLSRNFFEEINAGGGYSSALRTTASQRYGMLSSYFHNGTNFGNIGQTTYNLLPYLELPDGGLNALPGIEDDVQTFRLEQFLGVVPIPLLVGLQYIYYDKVVDITGKYPMMAYYNKKRIADADNALRTAIQEAEISIPELPEIEMANPPNLADLIAKDEELRIARLAARKARLTSPPGPPVLGLRVISPEEQYAQEQRAGQGGGEGAEEEQEEQERAEEDRTIGGRIYNNPEDIAGDKSKYQSLLEKANTIRDIKIALETRLRYFGTSVAAAENIYKNTDHWGSEYPRYDAFIQRGGDKAYREAIHEFVVLLNRASSLGITQYGTNQIDGGNSQQQRAFNNSTDLKIDNKDTITSGDFTTSERFHPGNPPQRSSAMSNVALNSLYTVLKNAMVSDTAGLADRGEQAAFYTQTVRAGEHAFGFLTPPRAEHAENPSMEIGSRSEISARNNTVIGMLCSLSYEVARLDETSLFRDLRISNWDPEQRTRVTGIIQDLTRLQQRLARF